MLRLHWILALALIACVHSVNASAESPLTSACKQFSAFDRTGDGQVEINAIKPLASRTAKEPSERVVLLVEQRLLDIQSEGKALQPSLERWADDLAAEGYDADVLAVDFAKSDMHQDGEYLLALREFLRVLHQDHQLAGVVLVGRFPDAYLVRTCNWHRSGNITLHKKQPNQATYKKTRYVRRIPEVVAQRCDIVLSDLDGRWEDVYVREPTSLPRITAVFEGKIPAEGGECLDVQTSSKKYEDCFHVADGTLEVVRPAEGSNAKPIVRLGNETSNRECSEADKTLPNVMAQPEIIVSRINAAGIAWSPREDIVGKNGKKLLDDDGKPQTVKFASRGEVPKSRYGIWKADTDMELQLIVDFFDRNHDYRTGAANIAWRPSAISCDLPSGYRVMRRAASDWDQHDDRRLADVRRRPQLDEFAKWINYPAVLRTVRAHTFPQGSQFRRGDLAKVNEMVDDGCWAWTRRGDKLEPSLSSACGKGMLNWFLLRSLWENGLVAEQPSFYHHTGCDAVSPYGAGYLPFTHKNYGRYQGAESLLLLGNGLALVGRAKVYYDEPRGFVESLRRGDQFGTALADYFAYESGAKGNKPARGAINRKRAYFWSVLGDGTLQLKKPVVGQETDAMNVMHSRETGSGL